MSRQSERWSPMSRVSDPCYMGQHDRCKSPFCRCALCGCKDKTNPEDVA